VTCPWCEALLIFESGNWAYERSVILQHLTRCERRPADATVVETADRLADGVQGDAG
jgi:hypothetical protein